MNVLYHDESHHERFTVKHFAPKTFRAWSCFAYRWGKTCDMYSLTWNICQLLILNENFKSSSFISFLDNTSARTFMDFSPSFKLSKYEIAIIWNSQVHNGYTHMVQIVYVKSARIGYNITQERNVYDANRAIVANHPRLNWSYCHTPELFGRKTSVV